MYTKGSDEKPSKTKYQVKVVEGKCIGAASCVAVAAMTYKMNNKNVADVIDQDGDDDAAKLLAAQSCPTGAIEVINTETGEKIWPK
jgi:ferredoxin